MHYAKRFKSTAWHAAVLGLLAWGAVTSLAFAEHGAEHPGASLHIDPSQGTITIGETFTATILLNTGGQSVNAVEVRLEFPPDKLQVVLPTAGKSLVRVWIAQPSYDNTRGTLRFEGAIPNPGVNTDQGVVSQVTFRVKGLGIAGVRFAGDSKVLLNDGKGTNILGQTTNGIYRLVLPPPAGPAVTSETHPDQEKWYANRTVSFAWKVTEPVEGYSYMLSEGPVDVPDDIPDGAAVDQTYKNLADGPHFFHIKALRAGLWGGVTHYALKIDSTPPADFPVSITPSTRTTTRRPGIHFDSTDARSGIDHFEIRIIPLDPQSADAVKGEQESFFVEATSPYVPDLEFGRYDIVIRAYDKAGNYTQKSERLNITTYALDFVREAGIQLRSNFIVPWLWIFVVAALLIILLGLAARSFWKHHHEVSARVRGRELPPDVQKQLEELRALRERYQQNPQNPTPGRIGGPAALGLLLLFLVGALAALPTGTRADDVRLAPPVTTLVSQNISNEEIFYVGGKAEAVGGQVVIYLQNLHDGAMLQESTEVEKDGSWFYSHPAFLSSGSYLVWSQLKVGDILSPPGPQLQLTVQPTALQLGATRLSYETIYLGISFVLVLIIAGLLASIAYHRRGAQKKHERFTREIKEIEESLRRGFAVLHRDIQREFALVQKAKLDRELSHKERAIEEHIQRDLDTVKRYIGDEIWELEQEL